MLQQQRQIDLHDIPSSVESQVRWHSAGDASRLAALLIVRIFPICSLFAPCQPGASPPSVHNELLRRDTRLLE